MQIYHIKVHPHRTEYAKAYDTGCFSYIYCVSITALYRYA